MNKIKKTYKISVAIGFLTLMLMLFTSFSSVNAEVDGNISGGVGGSGSTVEGTLTGGTNPGNSTVSGNVSGGVGGSGSTVEGTLTGGTGSTISGSVTGGSNEGGGSSSGSSRRNRSSSNNGTPTVLGASTDNENSPTVLGASIGLPSTGLPPREDSNINFGMLFSVIYLAIFTSLGIGIKKLLV